MFEFFSKIIGRKSTAKKLWVVYVCMLCYIVFLTPNRYHVNGFQPRLIPIIKNLHQVSHPQDVTNLNYIRYWINIIGNIILFIPFGLLIKRLYPYKQGKIILLYGLLSSICIELTQLLLQLGVCDIDDVLLNTLGTWCGIELFKYLLKYKVEELRYEL